MFQLGKLKRTMALCAALAGASLLAACAHREADPKPPPPTPIAEVTSIGTATMLKNGDIALHLDRTSSGRKVDNLQIFKPGQVMFEQVLSHVGPLKPGETKSVPPWSDEGGGVAD